MKRIFGALIDFLASYGLACGVMLLMFVITLLGTVEQGKLGLFQAQQRYFGSLLVMHEMPGGWRLPLPGAYLLMIIFSVNLLLGGLLRLKRRRSSVGLFIIHGGILVLLLGGLITHHFAIEGSMALAPGQTASRFESYHDWEVAVIDPSDPKKDTEYIIPLGDFAGLTGGRDQRFTHPALPFSLTLGGYQRNAEIMPAHSPAAPAPNEIVDGFFVSPAPEDPQDERNVPALYVTIHDRPNGSDGRGILWGQEQAPLTVEAGGKPWRIALRRRTWPVPFSVTLKHFTREYHPGTQIARTYESEIVKTEGAARQDARIRMNEPLRSEGYTFFQASFIENPRTGELSSVFAVVKNPADQFPIYACIIVTVGLLVHFGGRLFRYLRREREART